MKADAATLLRPRSATPGYGSVLLVLYRVFDLPEELRTRLRAKRAKAAATTAEVVQAATADSLPKLIATLCELGRRQGPASTDADDSPGTRRNTRGVGLLCSDRMARCSQQRNTDYR